MKKSLLSLAVCMATTLSMMGADKEAYTLTFLNGSGMGDNLTTTVDVGDVISSDAVDYVSGFENLSNAKYHSAKGIYVGKNTGTGSVTLNLTDAGKVKASKIALTVIGGANRSTATVNGISEDSGLKVQNRASGTLNYTLTGDEISQIAINVTNVLYITSITV